MFERLWTRFLETGIRLAKEPQRHGRTLRVITLLKKWRTRVGMAVAGWCLVEGVVCRERPFELDRPNRWVAVGVLLVISGVALRLAALGVIHKKESLATTGVYSLCRHPLYLGSMVLAFGFCLLLNDIENYILSALYFLIFYPIAMIWEEARLATRFGESFDRYRAATPLLLPLGSWQRGIFGCRLALRAGGAVLLATVGALMIAIHVMAETL